MKRRSKIAVLAILFMAGAAAAQQPVPGAHFIENWDLDGDGRVSLEEIESRRGDVFSSFDSDDDGMLTGAEYDFFDAARNADVADQPPRAQKVLQPLVDGLGRAANDADGDGSVSRAEFIDGAAAWLDAFDADGDAAITPADFTVLLVAPSE